MNTVDIALSIRQPWAWLIVHGHKDVENRTWSTRRRGRILVHTGQRVDVDAYDWLTQWARTPFTLPPLADLDTGGIVGETTVADCVEAHESPWFEGPFGLVLRDSRPLPFRACPGRLGFFPVPVGVAP